MKDKEKLHFWYPRTTAYESRPRWRQPFVGYTVGFLLVVLAMFINALIKIPHFIWTPLCLATILIGFFWGVGPAIITLLLGLLSFCFFIVLPAYHLQFMSIRIDFMIFAFAFAQVVIAFLAAQHEVQYRHALRMKQEIQCSAEELTATNQQLERANQLKDYFVTRAAHELRTPLTTILGEAQLALRRLKKLQGPTAELHPWKKHIETIEGQARGLHTLIEELIDLSSFRSGEVQLQFNTCDFESICCKVIKDLYPNCGRYLEFQCPSSPVILQADCERLSQVVINIVRNAILYSLENTTIDVNLSTDHAYALLQVHNDAPALTQEQQERIFEPFYRTPYAEIMFREGRGLGLTMTKEIVERHGGHIWIQSTEGKRFTCFVQIPRTQNRA